MSPVQGLVLPWHSEGFENQTWGTCLLCQHSGTGQGSHQSPSAVVSSRPPWAASNSVLIYLFLYLVIYFQLFEFSDERCPLYLLAILKLLLLQRQPVRAYQPRLCYVSKKPVTFPKCRLHTVPVCCWIRIVFQILQDAVFQILRNRRARGRNPDSTVTQTLAL